MLKKKNDFVVVKLISGEEVIGKVVEETDKHIVLSKPRVLIVQQTEAGPTAGLAPFLQLSSPDADIPFLKTAVTAVVEMMKEVRDDYMQVTSPLIQSPASGKFQL